MKRNALTAAITSAVFAAALDRPYIAPVMALRALNLLGTQYELLIYGDIGESWWGSSVLAADVVKQLNELPPTVSQINVRVNSYGGSVSDGLAIYNALKRMAATKLVTVDGVAMSIASLITMAGDTIEMPETSMLMIHAPWGCCQGNSNDMREFADFLDVYAEAMAGAYIAKSGQSRDAIMALLTDGEDHAYTGAQAKDAGFCDVLVAVAPDDEGDGTETDPNNPDEADEPDELEVADAFFAGMQRFTQRLPAHANAIRAALRRSHLFASAPANATPPAGTAAQTHEVTDMLRKINGRLVSLAPQNRHQDIADGGARGGAPAVDAAAVQAAAQAALKQRNDTIVALLKPHLANPAVAALQVEALADPAMAEDIVKNKVLAILAGQATPNRNDPGHIEAGADQRDKTREAASNYLLARAGASNTRMKHDDIAKARHGNPFNGMSLLEIARACAAGAGINVAGMSRDQIVAAAITTSTSDFPHIFENVLHKTLINNYLGVEQTWRSFCRTGVLQDFRPHNRYYMGGFSDLKAVDETGEYQDGNFSDAEKEVVQGQSKGRILNLSREMIINDDMGVFVTASAHLGQAAGRTLEKDVYALLAANPLMNDGYALFSTQHANVDGTPAVVGVQSFDNARVGMGSQMDPSGNDFLQIAPYTWLGGLAHKGDADVVNGSRYNVDVTNKFEVPNKSFGLFTKLVGTPRITGTQWYAFANPDLEPVLEVGFLDGIEEPQIASKEAFRSNGMQWRVIFDYGVGAVGWRGAWKNAGA